MTDATQDRSGEEGPRARALLLTISSLVLRAAQKAEYPIADEHRNTALRCLTEAFALARRAALEEATRKLRDMHFLLTIGDPADGPFTRQDRVTREVVDQCVAAILALGEKP